MYCKICQHQLYIHFDLRSMFATILGLHELLNYIQYALGYWWKSLDTMVVGLDVCFAEGPNDYDLQKVLRFVLLWCIHNKYMLNWHLPTVCGGITTRNSCNCNAGVPAEQFHLSTNMISVITNVCKGTCTTTWIDHVTHINR